METSSCKKQQRFSYPTGHLSHLRGTMRLLAAGAALPAVTQPIYRHYRTPEPVNITAWRKKSGKNQPPAAKHPRITGLQQALSNIKTSFPNPQLHVTILLQEGAITSYITP